MAQLDVKWIDSWNYLVLYAEEIETNTEGNWSRVHAWLDLHVAGHVASSRITVKVTGAENYLGYQYYEAGDHRLIDGYFYVNHNDDGSGSTGVNGSFESGIGNWYLSGTLGLTKINRYPYLNSGTNFKDTENPVFNITAYNTFPLRVKLEANGGNIVKRDLSNNGSQIYTLQLTEAERQLLRSLSPDGKSLNVRETVCALSGGNEIYWSFKDYVMTIDNKKIRMKINGQWKEATPYVRINGQWKEATPYIRVNSQWKEGI